MDIKQYLDPEHPYFFYLLGAVILLVYVIFSRRNLKKLNEEKSQMSEQQKDDAEDNIPKGIAHFTSLDNSMKWKVVLLLVLVVIGLYLVITKN